MNIYAKIVFSCTITLAATAGVSIKERMERGTYNAVARAKVVLRCLDQDGQVVSNATVSSGVTLDGNPETSTPIKGVTDKDGCFVVEGRSNGEVGYFCSKDGYYDTWEVKRLANFPDVYVSDGRWQPYGTTNTVVLKRVVNPVAMYTVGLDRKYTLIPKVGETLGYDLMEGDWIAPYGKGKTRDFDVTYNRDGSGRNYTRLELVLSTREPFAGFIKVPSDTYSKFKSPYHADTNAVYKQEMRFSFKRPPKGKGGNIDERLQESECIIMRTRTRVDDDGRLAGAYYGKIYGPMRFSFSYDAPGEMRIFHYFNSNENDPNLEADTTKNLLNPRDLNFAP